MTVFQASSKLRALTINPRKRVNYTLGMVLGVDDFVQESTWHTETLRQVLRDLVGYGSIRGLAVSPRFDTEPELVVAPGVALTPAGEVARVAKEQCASLNQWLLLGGLPSVDQQAKHRADVDAAVEVASPGAGTGSLTIHVVLDWAECTTDPRPLPGEPCLREDEVLADSRILDGFSLSLTLVPPLQIERRGSQALVEWLASCSLTDAPSTEADLALFLAEVESAGLSTPAPAAPAMQPPPTIPIPRDDVERWLNAALRRYVTKLRSNGLWLAPGQDATGTRPSAAAATDPPEGVLLATAQLQVFRTASGWQVLSGADSVEVEDGDRPFLLPSDFYRQAALTALGTSLRALRPEPPAAVAVIIAAGTLQPLASASSLPAISVGTLGWLVAREQGAGVVQVFFQATPAPTARYLLYAMPLQDPGDGAVEGRTVSVIAGPDPLSGSTTGQVFFTLQVRRGATFLTSAELQQLRLMVQVTTFAPPGP